MGDHRLIHRHHQRLAEALLAIALVLIPAAGSLTGCGTPPASANVGGSPAPVSGSGDSSGPPGAGAARHDLGAVLGVIDPTKLPASPSAVAAALSQLPATLNGHPVTARSDREVAYADGTSVHAQPLVEAAGPDADMVSFFPRFAAKGEFSIRAQSRTGEPLLWFTATSRPPYGAHVAALASRTGTWLFGFDAPSEAAVNDILVRFGSVTR